MPEPTVNSTVSPSDSSLGAGRLAFVGIVSLVLVFGFEMMRVFISTLTWTIGDRFGLGALYLGSIAFLVFGLAFTAGRVQKTLGAVRSLVYAVSAIVVLRLATQFWSGEPLVNFVMAAGGVIVFAQFLTCAVLYIVERRSPVLLAAGLLGGVTLETALQTLFVSYDPIWQNTWNSIVVTLLMAGVLLLGVYHLTRAERAEQSHPLPVAGPRFLTWMAIGPFVFLQLVIFQNIARLVTLTGWQLPVVGIWVLATDVLALFLALKACKLPSMSKPLPVTLAALALIGVIVISPEGIWAAVVNLVGTVSLGLLIGIILPGSVSEGRRSAASAYSLAGGIGMVLLVILFLTYYAVYQISLPYANYQMAALAAVIIGACGIVAAGGLKSEASVPDVIWRVPLVLAVLIALPAGQLAVWRQPAALAGQGSSLRVMSYNLHNGFNSRGDLDMQALVDTIDNASPDILILQEMSRGWLVDGSLDMLSWLSQRLDMPYVFGPTADPFWGNAVFSRFPILSTQQYALLPGDLVLKRGFTVLGIDTGGTSLLTVIATHLHHVDDDSAIRVDQVEQLLDFWDGRTNTVIAGDLNARPASAEMRMMYDAGLVDSLAGRDDISVYTYHSADLYQRIDYIWVSPDMQVQDSQVIQSQASDHQPVVATINR